MNTNIMKVLNILIISLFLISCSQHEAKETEVTEVTEPKTVTENSDPLPSWNDVNSKKEIIAYVADVTKIDSPN